MANGYKFRHLACVDRLSHTCPHIGKGGSQVDNYLSWIYGLVVYNLTIEGMEEFDKPLHNPFGAVTIWITEFGGTSNAYSSK